MIAMNNDPAIVGLYRAGYSLRQVGAICGIDRKTVRRHLVAQGLAIRPGNSVKRSEWLRVKVTVAQGLIEE